MAQDNTKRFSNRVADYVKYRPGYPVEIISYLQDKQQLIAGKHIADIGAGTGISAALFLNAGYPVIAVEPNAAMREKSVELLGSFAGFSAVDGTAEHTTLKSESVDAVIAGQAFHWFDVIDTKAEFKRILKEEGLVVLIWNERLTGPGFEKEYDQLIIQHGKDYVQVDHRNISNENIAAFFDPRPVELKVFSNKQVFDFEGLKGRLLSSSYMPVETDAGYAAMLKDLQKLFDEYQEDGTITINYETKVYVGKLK